MLEELCHNELWHACCAIRDRTPLVYHHYERRKT